MNLELLKQEIEYKWRKGPAGTELAYIDARQVMDLLDEVVGAGNWQKDYKVLDGKMYCGIGINVNEAGTWVWKWDMGTESNIEGEKGEASDSFKRAGVNWGIGRFLYDLEPKRNSTQRDVTPSSYMDSGKTCPKCGADMKFSSKHNKWYCGALCWKK